MDQTSKRLASLYDASVVKTVDVFRWLYSKFQKIVEPKIELKGLKKEMYYLEIAIKKTDAKIDDMRDERIREGTCPCCVVASYGGTSGLYCQLIDKNERRLNRLAQIKRKLGNETDLS